MSSTTQFLGQAAVNVLRADFTSLPSSQACDVFVGKHLDTMDVEVTPELLVEYAERTGGPQPEVPATLLFAHAHREIASWYLPKLVGNLHLRQEWQFFQAPQIGDVIRATRTVVDRYKWGKNGQREVIVCETSTTNAQTGVLLSRSRAHQSFLSQDRVGSGSPGSHAVHENAGTKKTTVAAALPMLRMLRGVTVLIDQTLCDLYVGRDADGNQLHTYHNDERSARQLGFDGVVVQGTLGVCILNRALESFFGSGWKAGGQLDVEFRKIVWLGDTLTAGCAVHALSPEGQRMRAQCSVFVENQHGTKVIVGTASAVSTDTSIWATSLGDIPPHVTQQTSKL